VVLEELEHAKARGARIYAEILGYGTSFDPDSRNIFSPRAVGATEAIRSCLADAHLRTDEIDYISASANSTLDCDAMETTAIKNVFNAHSSKIPASSIKSMVGECFSASGAMNVAAAIGSITDGFFPPTINYEKPDRRCDLDYVCGKARAGKPGKALVNAFSPTGSNSSLMLGKS
jgi:3-oxoacyl-[acyl-carrier-protein] synthase II